MSVRKVYGLFMNDRGRSVRVEGNGVYSQAVAKKLAEAMRRQSGEKIYARRIDISLTKGTEQP